MLGSPAVATERDSRQWAIEQAQEASRVGGDTHGPSDSNEPDRAVDSKGSTRVPRRLDSDDGGTDVAEDSPNVALGNDPMYKGILEVSLLCKKKIKFEVF